MPFLTIYIGCHYGYYEVIVREKFIKATKTNDYRITLASYVNEENCCHLMS